MSANYKGLQVSLEFDIHEDYIDTVIEAIKMIKYVTDVKPIESDSDDWMNRSQIKHDWKMKLFKFINDELK